MGSWLGIVLSVLLGSFIGSFLNVVLFRTHTGQSIVRGRSVCRSCAKPIHALDLIPLLNYCLLRGCCRQCRSAISWQYPAVELATGFLFALFYCVGIGQGQDPVGPFFLGLHLLRDWIFTAFLVLIFTYDLRYMLIPDRFTIPAMGLAILLNLWGGILPAWSMLAGAVVLAGFFWIQFTLSRGNWVGGGDIRMGALMGCMLGLHQGIVALFLAYVLGAIIGVVMMMCGKATRKTPVPCGSFLAAGTLLTMGVGESILLWYFHLFL